jgi:hypothetical protein
LTFIFIALAYVLAIGALKGWLPQFPTKARIAVLTVWVTSIFLGGLIVGWPRWLRMPGPYLVVADSRSVEPEGVAAAKWVGEYLGPDNRIAADRVNSFLMLSHGEQHPVTIFYDRVDTPRLFFSPEFGPAEQAILELGGIQYIVVDYRLSTDLPQTGIYFELGEQNARKHADPIDLVSLTKFDGLGRISRIFDSGDIVIYGVEGRQDAP